MRIVSCHITGYGKFNNADIDFDDGLNVINKDNGWGKTTLCSFIEAMFYGNPKTKGNGLNDRKKYKPWDNSVYGGNLTFEDNGKTYRIERFFGATEKSDTFNLYDVDTNLNSEDYSDNIGEELFGIDRASYAKSVYIPQGLLKSEMTGTINSKLGDLVTLQDDINNFDEAIKRINNEIKLYTMNSKQDDKKGLIVKLKEDINELREEADRLGSYEESLRKNQELLLEKQESRDKLDKLKEDLRNKINVQSELDQLTGEYNTYLKSYNAEKETLDELDSFFTNGTPSDDEIKEYFNLANRVDVLLSRCNDIQTKMPDEDKVTLLKELFDEPLKEEMIDDWIKRANRLSELRILSEHAKLSDEDRDALQKLRYYFAKKKPEREELDIVRTEAENVNRLEGRIEETKDYYDKQKLVYDEAVKSKAKDKGPVLIMSVIFAVIIALGSVAAMIFVESNIGIIMGISGIVIAVILTVFGIIISRRRSINSKALIQELLSNMEDARDKYEQALSEYNASNRVCREFLSYFLVNANDTMQQMISDIEIKLDKYDSLIESEQKAVSSGSDALEKLSSLEMSLYTELSHYQKCYEMEDLYQSNAEMELLQRLREDNNIYVSYREDDKVRSEAIEEREVLLKRIASYLNRYPVVDGENVAQKIAYVSAQKNKYEEVASKVEDYKKNIEVYEKKIKDNNATESIEELQAKQAEVDESLRVIDDEINQTYVQLRDVRENIDRCQEKSNQIGELRDKISEYNKKVDYLKLSAEYLTEAKENFLSTYMRPLEIGMRGYLDKIGANNALIDSTAYKIDTRLMVSVVHNGSSKEETYLSKGYRDLAAFSARLALIDIMYEGVRPMIILDDPFTNMDRDKIKLARELIEELSEKSQILYFTCHNSRA